VSHCSQNARRVAGAISGVLLAGVARICLAGQGVHDIKLPAESAVLTASPLPGYEIAVKKCGICHSADYINLQPPQMSLSQWGAEMAKMQHSYGAPIDDAEIKLLAIYLASTYGDATTVTPLDLKLGSAESNTPSASAAHSTNSADIDVHALLDRNACLSCHALQQKVVGPAYHDVAVKYAADPQARSTIEANIRGGGSGKWGNVAMPPFPNLSSAELRSLADFVLKQ
jgi:cytochrome c551/c552